MKVHGGSLTSQNLFVQVTLQTFYHSFCNITGFSGTFFCIKKVFYFLLIKNFMKSLDFLNKDVKSFFSDIFFDKKNFPKCTHFV